MLRTEKSLHVSLKMINCEWKIGSKDGEGVLRGCYIWDILANTISRTTTTILSIVVILIATPPPPNPKIKGLEPNSCMTAFRELIPLNTLFWTGKKLFWEKNDKILHWLAILNEDERKTCWNPGLIFQKNHRLITFTFLGIINRLFRM